MLCPSCHRINQAGLVKCGRCGAPLPATPTAPPRLNTSLGRLEEAAHQVSLGQISISEFETLITALGRKIEAQIATLASLNMPPDLQREMEGELAAGTNGLTLYQEALAHLHAYLGDRDLTHLQEGLRLATLANDRLNDALAINWQSFHRWQETVEETLAPNQP